jgi:hypothetical protein
MEPLDEAAALMVDTGQGPALLRDIANPPAAAPGSSPG